MNKPNRTNSTSNPLFWRPYWFGVAAAAASFFIPNAMKFYVATQLANSVLTVVGIIIGFVATSMTLLITAPDTSDVTRIKRVPIAYKKVLTYHSQVIFIGVAAVVLSLLALLFGKAVDTLYKQAAFILWIGSVGAEFYAFIRVVNLLHLSVQPAIPRRVPAQPEDEQQP